MSPTPTVEDTRTLSSEPAAAQPQPLLQHPTMEDVVTAIREEAVAKHVDCDDTTAIEFYRVLAEAVDAVRMCGPDSFYYIEHEILPVIHPIMDVVMPGKQVNPPDGSAHETINRHFLVDGEFSIVHSMRADQCGFQLEIEAH